MESDYLVNSLEDGSVDHDAPTAPREQSPAFQVPEAPHRPGDQPRFPRFSQQPGDLDRPDCLESYEKLRPHANGLVRVLSDDHKAIGPWNPKLAPEDLRTGLETMIRSREIDSRMLKMQRQGRLTFYVGCEGEEAVAVAGAMALLSGDLLYPAYRQLGLFLVRGMPTVQIMCQCIGNRQDTCLGRQMPVHYSWKDGNVVSISSPVGTQFPQAVGSAMASACRGDNNVTVAWMGEGTAAQGDFHHALNFASSYLPPVVLNVVNNQWAISTHRNIATGGKSFAARAEAYGVPGIRVDGNDFLAVYAVSQWAAKRARSGGGPTLIELLTYRAGSHSSSDDPSRYRATDEPRLWPGGKPLERLEQYLIQIDEWSIEQTHEASERIEQEVFDDFKKAESYGTLAAGPFASVESMVDNVYEKTPWHLELQRQEMAPTENRYPRRESA